MAAAAIAIMSACGGSVADPNTPDAGMTAAVVVTPSTSKLIVGQTIPLQAQAQDAAGQIVRNVTIFWSSSDTTVATVSTSGVVSARAIGTVQIAASAGGKSAVATLSVLQVPVASVTVLPASGTITVGGTIALSAVTYDSARNVLSGRQVLWATSEPQIATVDASGKVSGLAAGTVTITAASEGSSGTSTIIVTPAPVASVSVALGSNALTVGQTTAAVATTRDANGNNLPGRSIAWSSGNTAVATVNASGLVAAVGAGSTTITASSEGKSGVATITVAPVPMPVASVSVSPGSLALTTGQTSPLTATEYDANGITLSGRQVVWSSADTTVATVSSSGVITAVRAGNTTIKATSEGKSGTAAVSVQAAVAHVAVSQIALTIRKRDSMDLTARVYDTNGQELFGRTITWTSSNSNEVTVTPTSGSYVHVIAGNQAGTAVVTATSEGKHTDVAVTVTN